MFVDDDDYIEANVDENATSNAFTTWLTSCLKQEGSKEYSTYMGPDEFAYGLAGLEKCILLDLIDHSESSE